jgi:hypothetical protein
MDGMTFLGFVLIAAVGIGVPAVVLELLSPTRQRSAVREPYRAPAGLPAAETMAASIPAFFARPQQDRLVRPALGFDDAMFALIQDHVKAERAVVNEFVHFPSVDRLYARPSLTMN